MIQLIANAKFESNIETNRSKEQKILGPKNGSQTKQNEIEVDN